jgi:hypothetical protein
VSKEKVKATLSFVVVMLAILTMPATVSAVKMDVKPYGMIDLAPESYTPTYVHLYEMQCDGTERTLTVEVKGGTPSDLTFKIDGVESNGGITYRYTPSAGTTEYDIQVEIMAAAGTEGKGYIIYYKDVQSGLYDKATFTVQGQVTNIPEFTTIAVPVAAIIGLLFFFNYRKRKRGG